MPKQFKVGDEVRALNEILDEQPSVTIVCARKGDIGTIVDVVDDDAFDVEWPDGISITGLCEIEHSKPSHLKLVN
jgi:hypothetical protein